MLVVAVRGTPGPSLTLAEYAATLLRVRRAPAVPIVRHWRAAGEDPRHTFVGPFCDAASFARWAVANAPGQVVVIGDEQLRIAASGFKSAGLPFELEDHVVWLNGGRRVEITVRGGA